MEDNRLNNSKELLNGNYYQQPSHKHLMNLLNVHERSRFFNPKVNYKLRAGDVIEIEMLTNLQKKKTQLIQALCVAVNKRNTHSANFVIRSTEKDGLVIMRQYPLYSPWITSLKVIRRFE
ncbi:mitochondrial ribosomal protein L19, partial [Reticulomyxa filosa]